MSTPLSSHEIEMALADLKGWTLQEDALCRTFTFRHFAEALSFLVRLGLEAEKHEHHPEIHNVYNRVSLRLTTHEAGNKVTNKDVLLAQSIQHFSWV